MRLVVPLEESAGMESRVSDHFGSAPWFALVNGESGSVEIMENGNSNHEHGQCTPAAAFAGMGVQAVVCNGIGARAASRLQAAGVAVYIAGLAPTLSEAVRRYDEGRLVLMDAKAACQGHECH